MTQYTHTDLPGIHGNAAFRLPDGRQYPRVWWRTASEQEITDLGFVPYVAPEPDPPTLAERRDILIPRIERIRWDKEIGGMIFGGMPIPTDDRAKTLIMGARTAAVEQGETYSDEWKISPGVYVPLDAAAAIALGDALLAHIRACFAREKVLSAAALAATTHAELDLVENEINSDWPN